VSLTAQEPLNNITRTAIEALAAVLGGTQSLHTNSFDEALALPTEHAARIALDTQHVIAHETGVTSTPDPLGGSYFVEALTDRLEERAYDYFARIDQLGGMIAAIERNFPQSEIADAAYSQRAAIDSGERTIVGVNAYATREPTSPIEVHHVDPALEQKQARRVAARRGARDSTAVEDALSELRAAAAGAGNLMDHLLDCARAECTEGEIVAALQQVFGTYRETPVF
jgi:methylmalonyl-CoA mutase N-terminal domain/subunit